MPTSQAQKGSPSTEDDIDDWGRVGSHDYGERRKKHFQMLTPPVPQDILMRKTHLMLHFYTKCIIQLNNFFMYVLSHAATACLHRKKLVIGGEREIDARARGSHACRWGLSEDLESSSLCRGKWTHCLCGGVQCVWLDSCSMRPKSYYDVRHI